MLDTSAQALPNTPPPIERRSATSRDVRQLAKRSELIKALGLVFGVVALFVLGRIYWDERYYVAEEGLGYGMGLVGGVMMLLAMVYGLFKHIPLLRRLGMMRHWLRVHIFFGVMGPVLVLLHSTFHIGSRNGAVAMFSMLLVFLSGVIGRYLYSKIHYGLSGRKADTTEMRASLSVAEQGIESRQLDTFTATVMSPPASLLGAWWHLLVFGWRSRWVSWQLRREMRHHSQALAAQEQWSKRELRQRRRRYRHQLAAYMQMLRKVALFSVYERIFAFWRHAHVPFLILLLISGVVHVIAVHIY